MREHLRELLTSFGLRADASDQEAWSFYGELEGEQKEQAHAARHGRDFAPQETEDMEQDRTNADDAVRLSLEDERRRVTDITTIGEEHGIPSDRIRTAVGDGESVDKFRAYCLNWLREQRGKGVDTSRAADEPDTLGRVLPQFERGRVAIHTNTLDDRQRALGLSMALMSRCDRIDDPAEKLVSVRGSQSDTLRNLDDATRGSIERARDYGMQNSGMSLSEIAAECLRMDGHKVLGGGARGVVDTLADLSARGFSSSTLTNVFTTNFSAQFLAGYDGLPSTHDAFTRMGTVPDFRTTERPRLLKGQKPTRHTRGKEADHAEFDDTAESFKIGRYTNQFVVDDMDLIDDRFGALESGAPSEMGEAAAEIPGDLVYSILWANANLANGQALFSNAVANVKSDNLYASTALSPANIGTVIESMNAYVENGRVLAPIQNFVLVVPWALYFKAIQYVESPGQYSADGDMNPLRAAAIRVVADARLDNGVTDPATDTVHSGSATTWFVAAGRGRHTIEVAYLAGSNRRPSIRSGMLSQGKWGMYWDVSLDVGAKALDWAGMAKCLA